MVVHQPCRLHVGVHDCAADKLEAAAFEVLAQCIGLLRSSGNLLHGLPAVLDRFAFNKLPDVVRKAVELLLHLKKRTGVGHGRVHLQLVADDAGVLQELGDAFSGEAGDFLGIELGERLAITFAFVENRRPAQPRLGAFKGEELKLALVVVDRDAPLFIVVRAVKVARIAPRTALLFQGHRRFRDDNSRRDETCILATDSTDDTDFETYPCTPFHPRPNFCADTWKMYVGTHSSHQREPALFRFASTDSNRPQEKPRRLRLLLQHA